MEVEKNIIELAWSSNWNVSKIIMLLKIMLSTIFIFW